MTRKKIHTGTVVCLILAALLLLISLFPYYYMLLQSFLPWELVDKSMTAQGLSLKSYS